MRAVNLLPIEPTTPKLGMARGVFIGVVVTMLLEAALAGGFFLEKAHASDAQQQLVAVQTALAHAQNTQPSTGSVVPSHLQTPVVLSQQQPWHVALDAALSTRVAWDVFLRQLEYVVPAKVTLTNVAVGGAGLTAGATTGTITLGGSAFSSADIAVFLSTLARVPNISQVTLVNSAATGASNVQTFQVTAQMALPMALTAPPPVTDTTTTTSGG